MDHSEKDENHQMLLNRLIEFGSELEAGFVVTDPTAEQDLIVFINHSFSKITGHSFEEVKGKNLNFLHGKDTDAGLIQRIDQKLREGKTVREDVLHYKKDGSPFWNELIIQPVYDGKGDIVFITSFILDITKRKIDESLLKQFQQILSGINKGEKLDDLLQGMCGIMKSFFPEGISCAYLLREKESNWVFKKSSNLPKSLAISVKEQFEIGRSGMAENGLIVTELEPSSEHDYVASWSLPIVDYDNQIEEVFFIFIKEITSPTEVQLQYLEKLTPVIQMIKTFYDQQDQLHLLAYSDLSTGLPNRNRFLEKLKEYPEKAADYFVAIVEPNEYTSIIDHFGRDAASELFIQLARRIKNHSRGNYVGKLSSSSLVFTNHFNGKTIGKEFTTQLKKISAKPFVVAGEEMFITLKAGVALSTGEYNAEEMLRLADIAFTDATGKAGASVSFYKNLQSEEAIREMALVNELIRALSVDELEVHLQPKVNIETNEIIGFEALARWNSPVLGQVSPTVFIPVAENIGRIIELEIYVLTKVMKWQRDRMRSGKKMYQIAVNISVDHFFHASFVSMLQKKVSKYEVPSKYIRLEMTESIGLVDFKRAKKVFGKLNKLDFEVSIDDFGVGYSSLSYLPQLQVNELKIDRSFINALDDPDTYFIVMTIIQLANNLNLATVAEGIENENQIKALISLGCKIGQGFYIHKPMSFDKIELLLE